MALRLVRATASGVAPAPYAWEPGVVRTLRSRKIAALHHLATDPATPEQRLFDKVWATQRDALREIAAEAARRGLAGSVIKGAEFVERCFHPHGLDPLADLDLLIHPADAFEWKLLLGGLGYRPAAYEAGRGVVEFGLRDVAAIEGTHYELAPLIRLDPIDLDPDERAVPQSPDEGPIWDVAGRPHIVVEVDVHHGIATDVPVAAALERLVPSAHPGLTAPAATDHVWIVASRYYAEVGAHGKRSMRDLAYLGAWLRHEDVDWDLLVRVAAEHEIRPPLYYILGFLAHLGAEVPERTLAELDPRKGARRRDWGWPFAPLFDVVDPLPSYLTDGEEARTSTRLSQRSVPS